MRTLSLLVGLSIVAMSGTSAMAEELTAPVKLITVPTQIYFSSSNAKERHQGAIFFLIAETRTNAPIVPDWLVLTYRKGSNPVRIDRLNALVLEKIDVAQLPPNRLYSAPEAARLHWPHAFRLFITLPADLELDTVEAALTYSAGGKRATSTTTLPVRPYNQKTRLIFPFRGNGIVTVAGAMAGGHRNRSGLYAIDALGLTETYGPMLAPTDDGGPRNYAGWGREILAPAAGTVVIAKADHVDQPVAGTSDPAYFLPDYKNGGDPGNMVVIDHGNGEFSMIAHMRTGSVSVKAGDRVHQGQLIGLLGNSGDTSGPHLHYQLQNGPDWERSDALPFTFTNVGPLTPGAYFEAK